MAGLHPETKSGDPVAGLFYPEGPEPGSAGEQEKRELLPLPQPLASCRGNPLGSPTSKEDIRLAQFTF